MNFQGILTMDEFMKLCQSKRLNSEDINKLRDIYYEYLMSLKIFEKRPGYVAKIDLFIQKVKLDCYIQMFAEGKPIKTEDILTRSFKVKCLKDEMMKNKSFALAIRNIILERW